MFKRMFHRSLGTYSYDAWGQMCDSVIGSYMRPEFGTITLNVRAHPRKERILLEASNDSGAPCDAVVRDFRPWP